MTFHIRLTDDLQDRVVAEAARRRHFHMDRDTAQTYGQTDRSFGRELDSLGAEPAVCTYLGRDWEPHRSIEEDRSKGDIGDGIEVRQTEYPFGKIQIKDHDPDERLLFQATGRFPEYDITGWIPAGDGRKHARIRELQPGRPALWLDQKYLWPVE